MVATIRGRGIGAVAVWLVMAAGGSAWAACPPYPSAPWVGDITHSDVDRHVAVRYGGAWTPFLAKLERQVGLMEDAFEAGRVVLLRNSGEALGDDQLAEFVEFLRERLTVSRCLARERAGATAANPAEMPVAEGPDLNAFATAAGAAPREPANRAAAATPVSIPAAAAIGAMPQAAHDALRIEVMTECGGGDAIFRIRNNGRRWPGTSVVSVYRLDDRRVVSRREFTLAEMQRASLRIAGASGANARLGIFVSPSWYSRGFVYDATVDCATPVRQPSP